MTATASSIAFNQFVRLPLLGESWVERDRSPGISLYAFEAERDGRAGATTGPLTSFTVWAGRWMIIVDRPLPVRRPSRAATLAWIALGAPLVALVNIAACLLASPVRHVLASLQAR